tara:strand:- start:235 stop:369 length:135 start_codon:yes stop_codon:yes gene_type:complete
MAFSGVEGQIVFMNQIRLEELFTFSVLDVLVTNHLQILAKVDVS